MYIKGAIWHYKQTGPDIGLWIEAIIDSGWSLKKPTLTWLIRLFQKLFHALNPIFIGNGISAVLLPFGNHLP